MILEGKDVFIIVYMEGCGPCNATRPEWAKIESALKDQYSKNNNLVVIDVNKDFLSGIKHIGQIEGFPTMKYIGNHGKTIESYENCSITKKDRSVSSFIIWIESKINKMESTTPTSSAKHVFQRLSNTKKNGTKKNGTKKNVVNKKTRHNRKIHKGGKWSTKYKLSINCKKPKGFSQRQYCKYSRKK
jgi:thiol-disulfide isomerase/thioredoxin